MGRISEHFIGIALIVISAGLANLVAHQDSTQAELNSIIKPMIEKDISGVNKALASLAGKEVLPDRIDVNDVKNLNGAMDVFYNEHIGDLDKLVRTGDRYALRIISVLDKGRIIEARTHSALSKAAGSYCRLIRDQLDLNN